MESTFGSFRRFGLFFLASFALNAGAAETIAHLERFQGDVEVLDQSAKVIAISNGKGAPLLRPAQAIFVGHTIKTGPSGRALLVFKEGRDGKSNKIVLGAGSQLLIEDAASDSQLRVGKKGTSLFLQAGEVRSAVEARYERPGGYKVRTPNAVAGVRGTRFFIAYDPGKNRSDIAVTESEVDFGNESASVVVKEGNWGYIEGAGKPSEPAPIPPALDAVRPDVYDIEQGWAKMPSARTPIKAIIPPRGQRGALPKN